MSSTKCIDTSVRVDMIKMIFDDPGLTVDQTISKIDIICTDFPGQNFVVLLVCPQIVKDNELRKQIHAFCNEKSLTSQTIRPSGRGIFIKITNQNPEIYMGLTKPELEMFLKYHKVSIQQKLLDHPEVFAAQFEKLQQFHDERNAGCGKSGPIDMLNLMIECKMYLQNNEDCESTSLMQYIQSIENKIILQIVESDGYKLFNAQREERKNKNDRRNKISQKMTGINPYVIGETELFISLDIIKANFSVLYEFDQRNGNTIFNGCLTWEDFVRTFTPCKFLIKSKHFRQVVIGKTNPGRIQRHQKKILNDLFSELMENGIIDENLQQVKGNGQSTVQAGNSNSDEIIIRVTWKNAKEICQKIYDIISKSDMPNIWRIEIFKVDPVYAIPTSNFHPFHRRTFIDWNTFDHYCILSDENYPDLLNSMTTSNIQCGHNKYTCRVVNEIMGLDPTEHDSSIVDEFGTLYVIKS
jgi:hypothetical protein